MSATVIPAPELSCLDIAIGHLAAMSAILISAGFLEAGSPSPFGNTNPFALPVPVAAAGAAGGGAPAAYANLPSAAHRQGASPRRGSGAPLSPDLQEFEGSNSGSSSGGAGWAGRPRCLPPQRLGLRCGVRNVVCFALGDAAGCAAGGAPAAGGAGPQRARELGAVAGRWLDRVFAA
eukprot:gene9621-2059_t